MRGMQRARWELSVLAPEAKGLADAGDGFRRDEGVGKQAIGQVAVEDGEAGLFEARAGSEELGEDVLAGAAFFEHFAEAADLAFDPAEPVEKPLVIVNGYGHAGLSGC